MLVRLKEIFYNEKIKALPSFFKTLYFLLLMYGCVFLFLPLAKEIGLSMQSQVAAQIQCSTRSTSGPTMHTIVCSPKESVAYFLVESISKVTYVFSAVFFGTIYKALAYPFIGIILDILILNVVLYHRHKPKKKGLAALWRITCATLLGLFITFLIFAMWLEYQDHYKSAVKFPIPTSLKLQWKKDHPVSCTSPLPPTNFDPEPTYPETYQEKDCTFANGYLKIKELDYPSCKRLSQFTIIDKSHVYTHDYDRASGVSLHYRIEDKANPKTLVYLGNNYYKDNNHLFYDVDGKFRYVNNIDLTSVKVLSEHFLKDKNHVYFNNSYYGGLHPGQRILSNFDPATFELLPGEHNYEAYFKDKNGIYINTNENIPQKIEEADLATFIIDPQGVIRDKNHIYFDGKIVEGIDPVSYELLNGGYSRDKNGIYYGLHAWNRQSADAALVVDADLCTFALVDYNGHYDWAGYAKDKNHVYYQGQTIDGADPKTFTLTEDKPNGLWYARDKNHVIHGIYVD